MVKPKRFAECLRSKRGRRRILRRNRFPHRLRSLMNRSLAVCADDAGKAPDGEALTAVSGRLSTGAGGGRARLVLAGRAFSLREGMARPGATRASRASA